MKRFFAVLLFAYILAFSPAAGVTEAARAGSETAQAVTLPVLMYHRLLKNNPTGDIYTVTPAALEEDLRYLRDAGYTAVSVEELIDYVKNGVTNALPGKPVMLTFDDGHYNNIYYAAPLLEKYGMRGVVFIVGAYSDKSARENAVNPNYSYITWEQMETMPPCLELQNHTWDMHNMAPRYGIRRQFQESRAEYELALASDLLKLNGMIGARAGAAPTAFAHPFGTDCDEAVNVLKAVGIEVSFCSKHGINRLIPGDPDSLYGLKRLLRTPSKSARRLIEAYS